MSNSKKSLGLFLITALIASAAVAMVQVRNINPKSNSFWFASARTDENFEAPPTEWSKTYGEGTIRSATQTADGGYAIAGGTKRLETTTTGPLVNPLLIKTDQSGNLQWRKTYEPELAVANEAYSVIQTSDLGYTINGYGGWLLKTDAEGNAQWSKKIDLENSIVLKAEDSSCILAGNLIAHSGEIAFVKIDKNGNLLWNRTYGIELSWLLGATETNDGEYALIGNYGGIWLAKINQQGTLQWKKNYNIDFVGGQVETADISKTKDGGYVIAGANWKPNYSSSWMIKIDSQRNLEWTQQYPDKARIVSVIQLEDGGYVASGTYDLDLAILIRTDISGKSKWMAPYGRDGHNQANSLIAENNKFLVAGNLDDTIWFAKFSPDSNIQRITYEPPAIDWKNSFREHQISNAIQTTDGGYAIIGQNASGGDYRGFGVYSPLLVKTNSFGELEWKKVYTQQELELGNSFNSIVQTNDGGYAISGSNSIAKTDNQGKIQWIKTYDGIAGVSAIQKAEGGFALAATTSAQYPNSSEAVFIKTDENGNALWNRTFGTGKPYSNDVWAADLTVTREGEYAIAGTWGRTDFWFAKINSNGNLQANQTYTTITTGGAIINKLIETKDRGFILAGTDGYNRKRAWLIKTNPNGEPTWHYRFEDLQKSTSFESVAQTNDGGYVAGGSALVKVDSAGKILWNTTYSPSFVLVNRDGKIIIGYVEPNYMNNTIWLIQFQQEPTVSTTTKDQTWITETIIIAVAIAISIGTLIYLTKKATHHKNKQPPQTNPRKNT